MPGHTESALLASRLDGQTMVIPDLRRMVSHWPSGKNVHASDIEMHLNDIVDRMPSPKDKANITEANPALLASCLWPNASKDKLATLTLMVLWQGRLDDYIEALEYESPEKAKEFRAKAKEYIAQFLQLSEGPKDAPTISIISNFQQVAQVICEQYDKDQRRRLRVSLFDYIDSTASEMRYIQNGNVPTDRYYEGLRRRTGGAGPLCALAEFASGVRLSSSVVGSAPYTLMLKAVSVIIGLTNDLLSLSKELRKGRTFSVVPVRLWNSTDNDLKSVVERVVEEIENAVKNLDVCERRLVYQNQADADSIKQWAATLKTTCTGNLVWSLESKRYKVGEPAADGSLRQELKAPAA